MWHFAFWRGKDVLKVRAAAIASSTPFLNQQVPENLEFFQHDIPNFILHEFTRYSVPSSACSETHFELVDDTIISLESMDVFVAMVITCFQADKSGKVGGHCQELYNNNFSFFLFVAFAQLVLQNWVHVEQWCLEEVTLSSFTSEINEDISSDTFLGEATVKMPIPSSSRRLISVWSEWFSKLISHFTETIHDSWLLELGSSKQESTPFATFSNRTEIDEVRWCTDMTPNSYSMMAFVEPFKHLQYIAYTLFLFCGLSLFTSEHTDSINKLEHRFARLIYKAKQITLEEALQSRLIKSIAIRPMERPRKWRCKACYTIDWSHNVMNGPYRTEKHCYITLQHQ